MAGCGWLAAWGGLLTAVAPVAAAAELIVVANEGAGTLSIIDRDSGKTRTLRVGGDPHNLAWSADGRWLVVTHPAAGQVSLVDPRAAKVLARLAIPGRPHGVAIAPDGRTAFVGAEADRKLYRVDLAELRLAGVFDLEAAPHNLIVTDDGRAWITQQFARYLWLVDLETGGLVRRLETAAKPHDLAFARRGGVLWVTNWGSAEVTVVRGEPPRPQTVTITGRQPHHVVLTPDGREAWVTNHGSEDISIIDVGARREVARIPVGDAPHHVAFSADGRRAFVANSGSNDVSVIDVAARGELRRLPAGAHPHGIAAIPAAP